MNAIRKVVLNELFLVLLLLLGTNSVTEAATIVADGARCNLVDAITAANTNAATNGCPTGDDGNDGGDVIDLRMDVLLTEVNNTDVNGCGNGLPAVIGKLPIQGNGHTIARSTAEGVPGFRLLDSTAGLLTIEKATVTGGGLYSGGGSYTNRCRGGGINGTVTVIESSIRNNGVYDGDGGGIAGEVKGARSTFAGNRSDFGQGSAIYGMVYLVASTVSANSGNPGGAAVAGTAVLVNSTVSGNSCQHCLVGAGVDGTSWLINSTVTGNYAINRNSPNGAGGISGTISLANSIVANNRIAGFWGSSPGDVYKCEAVTFSGVNLIGDGSCDAAANGQLTGDPLLGPLADTGGPTLTHALLPGSQAIDAGDDAICSAHPVNSIDQRGVKRPQGRHCDLGAFELSTAESDNGTPALVQSRWSGKPIGSFEVVVREGDQLCHYYRSNVTPGYPWAKTACFGEGITTAPALIQSAIGNSGNFEIVVGEGDHLCHYYRNNHAPGYPWSKTQCFGGQVGSSSAPIQSRWPAKAIGSFEVVVREGERLCHYYRSNATAGSPWRKTTCFGEGVDSAPALIQSNFGNPGNFEVVVKEGDQLCHYTRNNSTRGYPWSKTHSFSGPVDSAPALIQSRWPGKSIGSFEVVVREQDQLCHYYRSNVSAGYPWAKTACFGDSITTAPALIQSTIGNPGNFEVVVGRITDDGIQGLQHYYRANSASGYPWYDTSLFGVADN